MCDIAEKFDNSDEYIKFDRVENKRSDMHAFLMLGQRPPAKAEGL